MLHVVYVSIVFVFLFGIINMPVISHCWLWLFIAGLELAQRQNEQEDLSCLPSLQKTDIDKNVVRTHLEHVLLGMSIVTSQPHSSYSTSE